MKVLLHNFEGDKGSYWWLDNDEESRHSKKGHLVAKKVPAVVPAPAPGKWLKKAVRILKSLTVNVFSKPLS